MLQTSFKYNSLCSWTVSRGGERAAKEDRYHTPLDFNNKEKRYEKFNFEKISFRAIQRILLWTV